MDLSWVGEYKTNQGGVQIPKNEINQEVLHLKIFQSRFFIYRGIGEDYNVRDKIVYLVFLGNVKKEVSKLLGNVRQNESMDRAFRKIQYLRFRWPIGETRKVNREKYFLKGQDWRYCSKRGLKEKFRH